MTNRSWTGWKLPGSRACSSAPATISSSKVFEWERHIRHGGSPAAVEAVPSRDAEGDRPAGRHEGIRQPLLAGARQADWREPAERVPADPGARPGWPRRAG